MIFLRLLLLMSVFFAGAVNAASKTNKKSFAASPGAKSPSQSVVVPEFVKKNNGSFTNAFNTLFYALSAELRLNFNQYYDSLEEANKSNKNVKFYLLEIFVKKHAPEIALELGLSEAASASPSVASPALSSIKTPPLASEPPSSELSLKESPLGDSLRLSVPSHVSPVTPVAEPSLADPEERKLEETAPRNLLPDLAAVDQPHDVRLVLDQLVEDVVNAEEAAVAAALPATPDRQSSGLEIGSGDRQHFQTPLPDADVMNRVSQMIAQENVSPLVQQQKGSEEAARLAAQVKEAQRQARIIKAQEEQKARKAKRLEISAQRTEELRARLAQERLVRERLAQERLVQERLAEERLAQERLSLRIEEAKKQNPAETRYERKAAKKAAKNKRVNKALLRQREKQQIEPAQNPTTENSSAQQTLLNQNRSLDPNNGSGQKKDNSLVAQQAKADAISLLQNPVYQCAFASVAGGLASLVAATKLIHLKYCAEQKRTGLKTDFRLYLVKQLFGTVDPKEVQTYLKCAGALLVLGGIVAAPLYAATR